MKTSKLPLPPALLEEMRTLSENVRSCALSGGEVQGLALVRLAPGLSRAAWRALAGGGGCEGWFALDLDGLPGLQELHHAAEQGGRDPVTQALNREAFLRAFQAETGRALRTRGNLSLILIELGHLSEIPAGQGDKALLALAAALLAEAQPQDVAGRLGPALALLMPEAGRFTALALAEKLLRRLMEQEDARAAGPRAAVLERPVGDNALAVCESMLQQGLETLRLASCDSPDPRPRVRVFAPGREPEERQTLVHASEKHFLFFGG